ncbi:WG repeat-containing protein [Leeuwenhoekiella blandensis]|uniref:WG repeat-containing protein n=1 Tax=Leeuwenhoekiella blandensis (strain CECT 7118 / CCUG 51940 / KCTC 22103 / MED217) TaxID=398720 RepID=A3XG91_LEEBM|nr:WG repeat-containing protein [Leeuwenhoekiella blandensis]EAQ50858.1 hypothetical protein MED217_14985 [Leeuwenhoekiella blandensis MED217]
MDLKRIILILILLSKISTFSQEKYEYKIGKKWNGNREVYSIIKDGDTILKLDSSKYLNTLQNKFNHFAIFEIKGKGGWSAIDINENYLFQVYNRLQGEPFPDYLKENRIRIVGENNKIGFANSLGEIIIKPQFKRVTEFDNGFAIFQSECVKIKNDENKGEHPGVRYECEKIGYIDKNGNIIQIGDFDFNELRRRINWNGN